MCIYYYNSTKPLKSLSVHTPNLVQGGFSPNMCAAVVVNTGLNRYVVHTFKKKICLINIANDYLYQTFGITSPQICRDIEY